MQNILVLGGAGFIGGNLVRRLVAQGKHPRIFTRSSSSLGFLEDILDQVEIFYGDFQDYEALSRATDDIDTVFHLISSSNPKTSIDHVFYDANSNFLPTVHLLDNCRIKGIKKIIYTSSGGTIYGEPQDIPVSEEHPLLPKSVYGQSKLSIENLLNFYVRSTSLDINIVRISNPYGLGQNVWKAQGLVTVAMDCAYSNQVLPIYGKGEAVRDYIYIDDVVEAMMLVAEKPGSSTINISSGRGYSIMDIVQTVEKVSGRTIRKKFIPTRSSDVNVNILSNQRAYDMYGWRPRVKLKTGITKLNQQIQKKMSLRA
jgi:UDP-glucose 4-epimerase